MPDKLLGHVTHYFPKVGVAVVVLTDGRLRVGDAIKVVGRGREFTQTVSSMQVDHQDVKQGKQGDEVAVKINEPVREKDRLFILS